MANEKLGDVLIGVGFVLILIFGSDQQASSISLAGLFIAAGCVTAGKVMGGGSIGD